MIDILTATPEQVQAEAERRQRLRAQGRPLHDTAALIGDPYTDPAKVGRYGGQKPVNLREPRSHGGRGGTGRRSKWQAEWAGYLHVMQQHGDLLMVREEGFSVALEDPDAAGSGRRTHYRPDFYIVRADGVHEVHEAKGYLEDDARKSMRWFAQRWPMLGLRVVTKKAGRWVHLAQYNCQPWPYGSLGE